MFNIEPTMVETLGFSKQTKNAAWSFSSVIFFFKNVPTSLKNWTLSSFKSILILITFPLFLLKFKYSPAIVILLTKIGIKLNNFNFKLPTFSNKSYSIFNDTLIVAITISNNIKTTTITVFMFIVCSKQQKKCIAFAIHF